MYVAFLVTHILKKKYALQKDIWTSSIPAEWNEKKKRINNNT